MTRATIVLLIVGSLITALTVTAWFAIYGPIAMPARLFAAGLSFVPLWALFVFIGIGLKRARNRLLVFVVVNAPCAIAISMHWRTLT